MDGKGHRVQIALEVKASFLDETFVFRVMRHREEKLSAVRLADPAKVGVGKGVGAGQQACRFRRSVFSQLDGESYRRRYNYNCQNDGESASNSHEMRSGMK